MWNESLIYLNVSQLFLTLFNTYAGSKDYMYKATK